MTPFQGEKAHTTDFPLNSEEWDLQNNNGSGIFDSPGNAAMISKSVHESALNLSVSVEVVSLVGTFSHSQEQSDQKLLNTDMCSHQVRTALPSVSH